jgi:hypothetical protein
MIGAELQGVAEPALRRAKALEKEQPGLCSFLDMDFREHLFFPDIR